jgi:hypothetical protein
MAASTVVCHGGRNHRRPIFWQAGSRLDAQCDHARIAPSALQCGGLLALDGEDQRKPQQEPRMSQSEQMPVGTRPPAL